MRRSLSLLFALLLALLVPGSARAVSCTMSGSLASADRDAVAAQARSIGGWIINGNSEALKTVATPQLAADFNPVSATINQIASELSGASLTVHALYLLHASDLKTLGEDVQFFCSVPGSQSLVTITLGELPPGEYALVLAHATGIVAPQQFALILKNDGSQPPHWELAGLIARPLTIAGHDSVWFWTQARELKTKNDQLSSFLYYEAAAYLARPSDVFTSNNLEKLSRETAAVEPQGLPGNNPMQLSANGVTFPITGISCDGTLGSLDLRVDTRFDKTSDPVAARQNALAAMAALVHQYPELRDNFHGVWVYETGANGGSFAVEQSMTALP